jgi:hypothetical protein
MRLEFSSILPVHPSERTVPGWDRLGSLIGSPPSNVEQPVYPPSETVLSADTLKGMLIEIGSAVTSNSLALAEALAKLGVPITESNMTEGQSILARLAGVSPAVFALAKALDLPTTPAIMKGLSAIVDRAANTNRLEMDTLDLLALLPQPDEDSTALKEFISRLIDKLGQSTENKLLTDPDSANTLSVYDARSALLGLAQTTAGGKAACAADTHAAYIEGQQLLNHVSMQKFDKIAPLYFAFPIALGMRESQCEIQVWSSQEQESTDTIGADKEEYLRAIVRVEADRIGIVETCLVGMWSGRLVCTISVSKPSICRLVRRDCSILAKAMGGHGWNVAPIEIRLQDRFIPLWLGGDLLDNPRVRVDKRI